MSLHFTRGNPNLLESYLSKFSERKKHYAYKNVYRFYAGFPQIPENLFCEKIYKFIKLTCDINRSKIYCIINFTSVCILQKKIMHTQQATCLMLIF